MAYFSEIQIGDIVFDCWWAVDICGPVVAKTKTKLSVQTRNGTIIFDKAHCRFLVIEKK